MTGRITKSPDVAPAGRVASTGHGLSAPLDSASRVDEIEARMLRALALGEYLPGARLPAERDLAASLGVGRMTVRHALARLVDQGLIETQRGRGGGSFVRQRPISPAAASAGGSSAQLDSLRDTIEAISRIHGTIAECAAEKRTAADVTRLEGLLETYTAADSGIAAQNADGALHLAVVDSAHNHALREVLMGLESQVSVAAPNHLWGDETTMAEMEDRAAHDHTALVAAIRDRDGVTAGQIARKHVLIDLEIVDRLLAGGPTPGNCR